LPWQRCRQEGKRVLQVIGGGEARSDMTTKHLAELDERDHQLKQRLAELRDELAAAQCETVFAAAIPRTVALFGLVWDLLLESVVDGGKRPGRTSATYR
jgi:hypothetical protein